jgi:hypothetical protein
VKFSQKRSQGPRVIKLKKNMTFSYKIVLKDFKKFHEAPHTVAQLYGLPQIFQQTISLFPEQSTLNKRLSFVIIDL